VPTTALGLLIFVLLLAPGLTYRAYRAASTPVDKPSALRELGGIALRSVACDLIALVAFACVHAWRPAWTPDIGALVRDPQQYLEREYDALFWWGLGVLVFACLLAALAASAAGSDWWARATDSGPVSWITPQGGVTKESTWWGLFSAYPDRRVYAGCTLDDGTYVGGWLLSYSPDSDETENRELALTGPLAFRAPEAEETDTLEVGAVTISARRLQYLTVSYLPLEDNPTDAPHAPSRHRLRLLVPAALAVALVALLPLPAVVRTAALVVSLGLAASLGRAAATPRSATPATAAQDPPTEADTAAPPVEQTEHG
jgi:hypothetical protein